MSKCPSCPQSRVLPESTSKRAVELIAKLQDEAFNEIAQLINQVLNQRGPEPYPKGLGEHDSYYAGYFDGVRAALAVVEKGRPK